MATAATKPFAWALAFACGRDNQLSTRRLETTREGYLFRGTRFGRSLRLGLGLSDSGGALPSLLFGFFARLRGNGPVT